MYENVRNLKFEFDSIISEYEKPYLDIRKKVSEFIGSSILDIEVRKDVREILIDLYRKDLLDIVVEVLCSKRYLESPFTQKPEIFLYEIAKQSKFNRVDLQTKYLRKRDSISRVIGIYNTYLLEIIIEFQILVINMKENDYPKLLRILKSIKELRYVQPFLDLHVYELCPLKFDSLIQLTESILNCKDRLTETDIIAAIETKIEELCD